MKWHSISSILIALSLATVVHCASAFEESLAAVVSLPGWKSGGHWVLEESPLDQYEKAALLLRGANREDAHGILGAIASAIGERLRASKIDEAGRLRSSAMIVIRVALRDRLVGVKTPSTQVAGWVSLSKVPPDAVDALWPVRNLSDGKWQLCGPFEGYEGVGYDPIKDWDYLASIDSHTSPPPPSK